LKKYILILTFTTSALFSIQIGIKSDRNISITNQEIQQTIQNMLKRNIKIDKKNAKEYIENNRILANQFIKANKKVPKEKLIDIKLLLEEQLAKEYVKNYQKNRIKIDHETIESYYKTHPDQFIKPKEVEFTAYKFPTFQEALNFYQKNEKNKKGIKVKTSIKGLDPMLQNIIDKTKKHEKTPPIFYNGSFIVFEIDKISPPKKLSLEESRNRIKNILYEKVFFRTRKELVDKIKSGQLND